MDVHEGSKAVKEAKQRVVMKRRLEKWEAWGIIALLAGVIAFVASYFL